MFTSFHKFSDAWWKIADGQAFLLCAEDFEIKQNEREKPCLHSLKLLVYIYISTTPRAKSHRNHHVY